MMEKSIDKIREAEKASHIEIYSTAKLFESGSWLHKPVKTVLDILPLFEDYTELNVLDLGSGVGRNCIPIAQNFSDISCRIDCVDILDFAIEELKNNSIRYNVEKNINGIVSSIDDFDIEEDHYDFILAVSALEHIVSEKAFENKLSEIQKGTKQNGIICMIINSEVNEKNKETGVALVPQFEVNLKTSELEELLENIFGGWEVLKKTVVSQRYDIPRDNCTADLSTNVVTIVARKG
ncbi:MAG: class I SAM-dependent methyltransferase [Ruminococcaceae bacterium]|nr:class I SAM-dependent methyltransferase [Oscillospiraceae bacterium]